MKKNGFSLIETLVVIAVISLVMIGIIEIMMNSLKAKRMTDKTLEVNQGANMIYDEVRRNLLDAVGTEIICSPMGDSVTYKSQRDGGETTLECVGGETGSRIASVSAGKHIVVLNPDSVTISGCQSFATCKSQDGSDAVSAVDVNFIVSIGDTAAGTYAQKEIKSSVTLRN
jgi:prepilin-type N-terminal cleavage/methylation domain-containing protein